MIQSRVRILVVDDDEITRVAVVSGLSQIYECVTAGTADDADQILMQGGIDLVLLDINMPKKTGIELLPEIRARHPDLAIVMLSGTGQISDAIKAMREGAFDYVAKPWSPAELATRVEHALARRSLVLQNREYALYLEQMVETRTKQLERRVQELTALNNLFQEDLATRFSVEAAYRELVTGLDQVVQAGGDLLARTKSELQAIEAIASKGISTVLDG